MIHNYSYEMGKFVTIKPLPQSLNIY